MSKVTELFNFMSKYVLFGFSHFELGSCHSHIKDSHEVSNVTHFSKKTEESSRPESERGKGKAQMPESQSGTSSWLSIPNKVTPSLTSQPSVVSRATED